MTNATENGSSNGITNGGDPNSYRSDSETIMRASRQLMPMSNPLTGFGSERDPATYFNVTGSTIITEEERATLFRCSRIAQNIVMTYPTEASWFVPVMADSKYTTIGKYAEEIMTYLSNLKTGSLEAKTREVSFEARLNGEAWLLLGIDDGQDFVLPIDESRINSFQWVQTILSSQISPVDKEPDLYKITLASVDRYTNLATKVLIVHESRLIKFVGEYLPPSVLRRTKKHDSCLQAAFDGLSIFMQGLQASNSMLADHSLFWYKLDGLSNLIRQKKHDEIYSRFLSLQMSKSVLKGIAMDAKNEDAGFINRNYGGVQNILETMEGYLVSATGMVRSKILGTSNRAGLGAEGRGVQDRLEHSLKLSSWQRFCWRDNLIYVLRLALLAKDSPTKGRLPKKLNVQFPPVLELSPDEIGELYNSNVNWAKTAIDAGMITQLEARLSLFSGTDAVLNPQIMLDERVTAQMEQQANLIRQPLTEPDNGFQTPNVNSQDNPLDDLKDILVNEEDNVRLMRSDSSGIAHYNRYNEDKDDNQNATENDKAKAPIKELTGKQITKINDMLNALATVTDTEINASVNRLSED